MIKSGFYILLLAVGLVLAVLTAISIPQVFIQQQADDLADDLLRANVVVQSEMRIFAFEQVSSASTGASDGSVVAAFTPPAEGQPPRSRELIEQQLTTVATSLAAELRRDLFVIVDDTGRVVAGAGEGAPPVGTKIVGMPPIRDALRGLTRDWYWMQPNRAFVVAAAPIVIRNQRKVMGAVLTGEEIDSSLATRVLRVMDPVARPGHRVHIGFFRGYTNLASSARDASTQTLVLNSIGQGSPKTPENLDATSVTMLRQGSTDTASLLSTIGDGGDGEEKLGVVLIGQRATAGSNVIKLAAAAVTLDTENPDNEIPVFLPFLTILFVFLVGFLLLSAEHSRPARKLLERMREVSNRIETQELSDKGLDRGYQEVVKEFNAILLGLRKKIERERAGISALTGEIQAVALTPPPSRSGTSAAVRKRPRAFSVSHVSSIRGDTPTPSPTPAPDSSQTAPAVIPNTALEPIKDERPGAKHADVSTREDPFALEMAKAAAAAAAVVSGSTATAAGHESTVDISRARLPEEVKPIPPELDTAEVARDDAAFINALAASADSPTPAPGPVTSQAIGHTALAGAASPSSNPFVHQAPTVPGNAPMTEDAAPDPDQEYFEKLFEQFVKTKQECGEDTEGLTPERFAARLDQNKAKLMERYGCRTVRFQVYVKNGKAALKATPVK